MATKPPHPHRIFQIFLVVPICVLIFSISACTTQPSTGSSREVKIVATTSIVGDIVSQVGGDKIALHVLLPLGTDPHSFTPTPRDASAISDASLIFANGAGLETFLSPLLENIGGSEKVVEVSLGIEFRSIIDEDSGSNQPVDDPHTWMVPNNVSIWVDNIIQALSAQDPQNAEYYRDNGRAYLARLQELDSWIRTQVNQVPEDNRQIITEHLIFGYFADRYRFVQVGTIIPGFSSLAEPSAQDIAQIEDDIRTMGVKAIFLNVGVNTNIAQRIADDTGTKLVFLYMHSLSDKGGEADNYIDFMQYNVAKMVDALK